MRPLRAGFAGALATGTGLSAIVVAGGLLASGMMDAERQGAYLGPHAGAAIELPADLPPSAEPRRRERPVAPPRTTSAAPAPRDQPTARTAPRRRPSQARRVAVIRPTTARPAPSATAAARDVTLTLAGLDVEPVTEAGAGRMRLRFAVEEASPPAGARALPQDVEVEVAVPDAPHGKAVRLAVELVHTAPEAQEPSVRVQATIVDTPAAGAALGERSPKTATASNVVDVVVPADVASHAVPPATPAQPAPAATVDVQVPVGSVADHGAEGVVLVEVPSAAAAPGR